MKKLYILIVTSFFSFSALAQAPSFAAATSIGGAFDDIATAVTSDASGNIYVGGYFQGTMNFATSGPAVERTASGAVGDAFIARYTSAGALSWVVTFGNTANDRVLGLATDGTSVYATGFFVGNVNFNPNGSSVTSIPTGAGDIFLAKYNASNGVLVFVKNFGSADADYGYSVSLDATQNVYITGGFSETVDFDPSTTTANEISWGKVDMFLAKYSSSGSYLWSIGIGGGEDDEGRTCFAAGNDVFIGGRYSAGIMPDPNDFEVGLDHFGGTDGYIGQYNASNGNLIWGGYVASPDNDDVAGIWSDGENLFTAGTFTGTATAYGDNATQTTVTSKGETDGYMVRHTLINHTLFWANSIGSTNFDYIGAMTSDGGNLYVTGSFSGQMDVDPLSGVTNLPNATGTHDAFLGKYNYLSGSLVNAFSIGSSGSGSGDEALAVNYNRNNGSIYWAGIFQGNGATIDLNPFAGVSSRTNLGGYDVFFGRFNPVEPNFSPTTLQASDIGSTTFYLSFVPTGFPDGFITLYKDNGTFAGAPVDGVTYLPGDVVGNGKVLTIGPKPGYPVTGATPSTTYSLAVYAYNGSGSGINYRATSPATTTVVTTGLAAEPSAQPTNLVFSNVTATGFDFSYTASTSPGVSGYLGIRSIGSPPTLVPSDGVVYEGLINATNDERVAFSDDGISWTYEEGSLVPNTTYYFAIYAYSGSGTSINYLPTNPLTGNQKTLDDSGDTDGPSIDDNTVTTSAGNIAVTVTADITDTGSGVAEAYIEYYSINDDEYGYQDMVQGAGNTWTATMEARFNKAQGVEYTIYAYDNAGNGTQTPWTSVVVSYGKSQMTIQASGGLAQTNYRIISIPLELAADKVVDVFKDDLGDYDRSKYRLFSYQNSTHSELGGSSSIEVGKGYWFIAAESQTIDTGAGKTILAGIDKPITVPVSNGWNLIGNPYVTNIDWSLIKTHADNSDKTFGDFKTYEGGFTNATRLNAMSGGFIMMQAAGDGKLRIPMYADGGRVSAPTSAVNFKQAIASGTWSVDLLLKSGSVKNSFAGFGMHPYADEQNDRYDDFTLPRFLDYLELNYNKKLFGSPFTKDIVPTTTQYIWDFDVESNLAEEVVEITWDNSYLGNTDLQLVLWDVNQQRATDMKSLNKYTFGRSESRSFRILFGSGEFVNKEITPFRPVFHSASPVPSAGNINFAFSVPESAGQVKTSLVVYNMMGQKVANLVDSALPAGYQQALWNIEDGTKPAAGVYISVLKFGNTTLQKRLIIK